MAPLPVKDNGSSSKGEKPLPEEDERGREALMFLGISSFLVLFTLSATAIGSEVVSTVAQRHPGASESLGAGNKSGYFDSKGLSHSTEVPTPTKGTLESGDKSDQRKVLQEREPTLLQAGNPDGSSGEMMEKRHVALVIAVPSARPDRRKAIRETWLKWADDRVVLRFFVEPSNEGVQNGDEVSLLAEESLIHGDIVLQDIGRGMNFGLKLLWAMRWMSAHYSFDFFLRLDDDYFLCLERLLDELACLLIRGNQPSPIYAGYRACRMDHKASYVDESYILLSSVIIDRILNESDLMCSGFGSLTAGAWLRVGGPGNPKGDVAFVDDYRLDRRGFWWKYPRMDNHGRSEISYVCARTLGIHHSYPDRMNELWLEVSSRTNESQATGGGCHSSFRYEDNDKCPYVSRAVDDKYLQLDNVQLCDSFSTAKNNIWCGGQGC